MLLDLVTLGIVIAALAYLGRRWVAARKAKAACDGCGPAPSVKSAAQTISVATLKSTLLRK